MKSFIGIAGNAGVGKDTFADCVVKILYSRKIGAAKINLANALKFELYEFVLAQYGIDVNNCSREEKELIRPIYVAHGKVKRRLTKGKYWTNFVDETIELFDETIKVFIIPDIRYVEYEEDEYQWLKAKQGNLIYLHRSGVGPANDDELKNNKVLEKLADYNVEFPNFEEKIEIEKFVKKFLDSEGFLEYV